MFTGLLDLLFPRKCCCCKKNIDTDQGWLCKDCIETIRPVVSPLCRCCGRPLSGFQREDHICGTCLVDPPPFAKARSLFFHEGAPRELLLRLKYGGDRTVIRGLLQLICMAEPQCLHDYDYLVPVPLHPIALRRRGWNQALLLAECLGAKDRIVSTGLVRKRMGPHQAGRSGRERRASLRGVFAVQRPGLFSGCRVCLVDDVFTTGTTTAECSRTLLGDRACEIDIITLTRSGMPNAGIKKNVVKQKNN